MNRTRLSAALLVCAPVLVSHAQDEAHVGALPWQTIADCAAGYRANWQNRLTGFNRSRDMSNMIEMQANDFLEAAIKQRTPKNILFGTETPGSGSAIRPETGKQGDDLVPIIGAMKFLSEAEKLAIFHGNAEKVCPGLSKLG